MFILYCIYCTFEHFHCDKLVLGALHTCLLVPCRHRIRQEMVKEEWPEMFRESFGFAPWDFVGKFRNLHVLHDPWHGGHPVTSGDIL